MAKTRLILSIDGGGIRGLIPAVLLKHLENRLQAKGIHKPLCECFDLITGTSTGGIIAAGLVCPHPDGSGKPAATVDDLIALYEKEGSEIFEKSWLTKVKGIFGSQYDAEPLERKLKDRLGTATKLSQALAKVVITAYDIENRRSIFLSNVQGPKERDIVFWKAARGTSAAPTYFKPARVETTLPGGQKEALTLIDGGTFANDPAIAAYVEAVKLGWHKEKIIMLSLGTGEAVRKLPYEKAKSWGALDWISPAKGTPLISVFMHGQANTASYQASHILNKVGGEICYIRIDGPLKGDPKRKVPNDDLDDTRPDNILALKSFAYDLAQKHSDNLDSIASKIAERNV